MAEIINWPMGFVDHVKNMIRVFPPSPSDTKLHDWCTKSTKICLLRGIICILVLQRGNYLRTIFEICIEIWIGFTDIYTPLPLSPQLWEKHITPLTHLGRVTSLDIIDLRCSMIRVTACQIFGKYISSLTPICRLDGQNKVQWNIIPIEKSLKENAY